MADSGYSGTPLIQKLGLKPSMRVLLINPPLNYEELLNTDISSQQCKKSETPDFVHLFVKSIKEFEAQMKKIEPHFLKNSKLILWVSWYKKISGIKTDISEDVIRIYALAHNLVDIKVCAVDENWSGLKLVVPLAKR
jgi:hypothetical protein